jgi:hypothetical protein|uniref:Nucleotide-diphospho-sugar transferase n=1 Tax=Desulfurella acetivorans TaxID=33002 RepID=A0A832AXC6_DESAE
MNKELKTAVLMLTFKRLSTTKEVFEQIKKTKPPRLYIASDGPRENIHEEAEKVNVVRDFVMSHIDWDCKVKTLFRDKNLGSMKAVSEAITWFFENEEKGIILEDDCVPSLSFFWFCEELLNKYKDNLDIWHIGGSNFQNGIKRGNGSYYFSALNHVWGWASWANRWKFYDVKLNSISDDSFINQYWSGNAFKYWSKIFWTIKNRGIDAWDYQWTFTMWFNKGLAILPNLNLITNIGFYDARSGVKKPDKNMNKERYELDFHNFIDPVEIKRDTIADEYTMKHSFYISLIKRILRKLKDF